MRHGLAPAARGVFSTIDLEGEDNSNSLTLCPRFCLLGELDASGCLVVRVAVRRAYGVFSLMEHDSGSGDESGELWLKWTSLDLATLACGAMVCFVLCRSSVWKKGETECQE